MHACFDVERNFEKFSWRPGNRGVIDLQLARSHVRPKKKTEVVEVVPVVQRFDVELRNLTEI